MKKVFKSFLVTGALIFGASQMVTTASAQQVSRLPAANNGTMVSLISDTETTPIKYISDGYAPGCTSSCMEDPSCCDSCGSSCGCECIGNWVDNTQVFFGGDAYKSIGDSLGLGPVGIGLADNFGLLGGFNTGLALGDSNVRAQVGASYGIYDFKGRLLPAGGTSQEQQVFVTLGLYKRSDIENCERVSWGVVYDQMAASQWGFAGEDIYLGQVRGILGYALNECNEVGVWGTFHTNTDGAIIGLGGPTNIRAANQVNSYLRHNWAFGASSMAYVGVFDQADIQSWQFGLLNTAPLSDYVSLYGNFNYAVPGAAAGFAGQSEEQWNVSVGLMYSFGGKAVSPSVSGQRGLPLLPVANNGNFLITN